MRRLVPILAVISLLPACSVVQLSAQHSCVDTWGRSIPQAERTRANCIDTWTQAELTESLNRQPVGASGTAPGVRGNQAQVNQVYLPTGGYQITRSGSTVFVNQTSRGR